MACAGACYRLQRTPSLSSISSMSSVSSLSSEMSQDLPMMHPQSPAHQGVKDGAIFPGFEVAGIIESLGAEVLSACGFKLGDRVVIYPYEGVPHGYVIYYYTYKLHSQYYFYFMCIYVASFTVLNNSDRTVNNECKSKLICCVLKRLPWEAASHLSPIIE